MEKIDLADAIYSVDSEYVMLGVKELIFNINYEDETCQACRQEAICSDPDLCHIGKYSIDKWQFLAFMSGSNYVKKFDNLGIDIVWEVAAVLEEDNSWSIAQCLYILTRASECKGRIKFRKKNHLQSQMDVKITLKSQ